MTSESSENTIFVRFYFTLCYLMLTDSSCLALFSPGQANADSYSACTMQYVELSLEGVIFNFCLRPIYSDNAFFILKKWRRYRLQEVSFSIGRYEATKTAPLCIAFSKFSSTAATCTPRKLPFRTKFTTLPREVRFLKDMILGR